MTGLGDIHLAMQAMFLVWSALTVLIVRRTIARGSVGLPTALVLTMSFLYGGCFVYAVPGYTHLRPDGHWYLVQYDFSETLVMQATFASLLGVFGFAIGCGVFGKERKREPLADTSTFSLPNADYQRAVLGLLGGIALASFALHYLRVSFPMSGALLEAGRNLAVVCVCLGAVLAARQGQSITRWIAIAALIPLYYLVIWGFVSYGFLFGILIIGFWFAQIQKPVDAGSVLWRVGATILVVYVVLTLFVGWSSFRNEIRLIIWQGAEGSLGAVIWRAITQTEIFSLGNFDALDLVNIRLNLNIFIGRMIEQHQLFPELRQWGATLIVLPLVLLPRFIWPGKPARGGSGFMSEHTGITLSESATFGTGTVFEFFINFGYIGVFLGFIVLGLILTRIDRRAAAYLAAGDYLRFARLFVVGIVATDPLLRPFFIVNGAVFAWIIMTALNMLLARHLSKRHAYTTTGTEDTHS
jgi:hypothetical protein